MFSWGNRERRAGPLAPCRVLAALLALALMRATSAGAAGVVGIGTPTSCTESALETALAEGGMVTFDCGSEPVTLTISSTKAITRDTTIDGGGRVTIDGAHKWQVFTVDAGITVAVQNLTIANGNDGGIANVGTLIVTNSTFSGNTAPTGGGIANVGTLTVTNSTFSSNRATYGGGIANIGTLTVINSTFSGNIATYGGGIANNGTLTVTNSTLSGNIATNFGGGMLAGCLPGVPCHPTTLTLTNSIVSGNDGGDCFNFSSGTITDGGHNLIGHVSCGLVDGVNRNIVGIAPMLDPDGLKDNGGPTLTIALCTGVGQPHPDCRATSPAIDAGDTAQLPATDQRGAPRPYSAAGDMGAYESGGLPWVCDGNCRIDGAVTVDELLTMVNIALGTTAVSACTAGDRNQDAAITVDEILVALHNALNGCPGPPTPKPTYTPTPATVTPTPAPGGKKIMMLGDSITNGGCYAPYLYENVRAGGHANATFVGTMPMASGVGVTCSGKTYYGTPANEGHGGYSTAWIIPELPGWLWQLAGRNQTPDIVLMHLGTNNFWNGYVAPQITLNDYTTIVGQLRAANPYVKIIVAQIIPLLYSATTEQCTTNLSAAIPAWRDSITTTRSPVYIIDFESDFDPAFLAADLYRCHPDSAGAQWMADKVYPLLASLL